ncbi:MAG: hypothetical protein M1409_00945 [Actinobacteria bacterium]|nr:hypothetical protein [Actinomycetota bacterium]
MVLFNNSTGFWTGIYLGGSPNFCAGKKNEIFISKIDKIILRNLAEKVADLSLKDSNKEKIKLWYEHNDLKSKLPLIFCDPENGWNEIIKEEDLQCVGDLAKRWEFILRREIFYGNEMLDDKPIINLFEIGYTFTDSEWGVKEKYHGGKDGQSFVWDEIIKNDEDIQNIKLPEIIVDYKSTVETICLAKEIFGDILNIKLRGVFWHGFAMTLELAKFVGLNNMMLYMYDKPKLLHELMNIILKSFLIKIDFLENDNLLSLNNDNFYVGSGGLGYTSQLPNRDLDKDHVKSKDLWCHTESQETVGVSPQMFEEFVFQYQLPIHERFGLNCYGCCEPLDKRWEIVKNIPNLRRVSVSSWADKNKMAEYLQDKFIYSFKPSPSDLAVAVLDHELIHKKIRQVLELTKGCVLEIIMKDNHTICNNINNVTDWVKIAREEIRNLYW